MSLKKILALSSSRTGNEPYLETASLLINDFLGSRPLNIAFIPFASVSINYGEYAANVGSGLSSLGHSITLVNHENAKDIIEQSEAIMVGGGNTFKLLHDIYEAGILDLVRDKVNKGVPYVGWSAGSNILSPTIGTTNDMPIIQPKSFNALGLFPFQINPHYIDQKPVGHNGETRSQRLLEFMMMNPGLPVVGLPEGTALQLTGSDLKFIGKLAGILFLPSKNNVDPVTEMIMPGEWLSYLL